MPPSCTGSTCGRLRKGVGSVADCLSGLSANLRRSPGISSILLEVEPRNAGAIAFYRRHGFVDHGHTGDCGGSGDRIAALIMRRSLAD